MVKDRYFQAIRGGAIAVAVLLRRLLQHDASVGDLRLFKGWALAGEEAVRS